MHFDSFTLRMTDSLVSSGMDRKLGKTDCMALKKCAHIVLKVGHASKKWVTDSV